MSAAFAAAQALDSALAIEGAAFDALANMLTAYEHARHGLIGAVCEACTLMGGAQ